MVIITFDDAVNSENWDLYTKKLFIPTRSVALLPIRYLLKDSFTY